MNRTLLKINTQRSEITIIPATDDLHPHILTLAQPVRVEELPVRIGVSFPIQKIVDLLWAHIAARGQLTGPLALSATVLRQPSCPWSQTLSIALQLSAVIIQMPQLDPNLPNLHVSLLINAIELEHPTLAFTYHILTS